MAKNDRWSDEELRAAVKAYLEMRTLWLNGDPLNKASIYQALSRRYGRSEKSFEYRMQNISHVFTLMGKSWIPGLKPARNVGTETAARIEELVYIEEGIVGPLVAGFEQEVLDALKKTPAQPPAGAKVPRKKEVVSTQFLRDPAVVAWVLQQANGQCERCQSPAPFTKPSGSPYLEVHHVRRLSDGGADTVYNAVALCPNCHRELHHGIDQEQVKQALYQQISRLVP